MKENKYDQPVFFEKYSQMDRSVKGLSGAGEWKTLEPLMPDFEGKAVLDLGCGFGWHCLYAAGHGAGQVVGVELSARMLERAQALAKEAGHSCIRYIHGAMEDVTFPSESFDVVLSSLALHYTESFEAMAKKIHGFLKPGGIFLFNVEHPVFTARGNQDWYYDQAGRILHFPVDRYFSEGRREACFLGEPVVKYHRTLTTYLDGLMAQGFALERVVEPMPPEDMLDLPGMRDELRRPMMLIVKARRSPA